MNTIPTAKVDTKDAAVATPEVATEMAPETEPAATTEVATAVATEALSAVSSRLRRAHVKTTPLDPRDVRPTWPMAIASLERLSGWAVFALRLGTLALIQQCVRELAEPDAHVDTVVRLRALTDALAHMPMEV